MAYMYTMPPVMLPMPRTIIGIQIRPQWAAFSPQQRHGAKSKSDGPDGQQGPAGGAGNVTEVFPKHNRRQLVWRIPPQWIASKPKGAHDYGRDVPPAAALNGVCVSVAGRRDSRG